MPLGVLDKNENKGDEMADILSHLHQYVPSVPFQCQVQHASGEVFTEHRSSMHRIIVGGDQLTAARIRGAQKAKSNAASPEKRVEGIIPCADDWHTKANFLGVRLIS